MVNTITRFGWAADGREAIRCIRCSSRRKEALSNSEFRIPNSEFVLSLLTLAGRFPSWEGSGVGWLRQSHLFLSDLLTDLEPILTPSHEESLHSEALRRFPSWREVVAGSPPGRDVAASSPPGRGQGWVGTCCRRLAGSAAGSAGRMPAARSGSGRASLRFFACITMNCPVQRRAGVSPAQQALARERESKSAVGLYVFSVVGTSRCDVRAACSDATPSNAIVAQIFIPPATTRAGTAQRAIPTIALNTYICDLKGRSAIRPRSTDGIVQ